MLSLAALALYQYVRTRRSKGRPRSRAQEDQSQQSLPSSKAPVTKPQPAATPYLRNFYRFLSDFHKLQCCYSITLQIASFIALYGPPSTTASIRNPFDEAFLLLVSTNGIIPIAVTFYTLGLCEGVTLYHVLLTSLCAISSSCTGIEIVKLLSKPYDRTEGTRFSDTGWPAATGGLAPEAICGRKYEITYPKKLRPNKIFLAGTALSDALIFGVIVWWVVTSFPCVVRNAKWSTQNGRLTFVGRLSLSDHAISWMRRALHVTAAFILVWCATMEYFFFYQTLVPQYDRIVNFRDWGFGQIVGIAVWAVVMIDFVRRQIASLCGYNVQSNG